MFLTDQPTAVSALPTPAKAGTPGYFTNGNPAGAQPATILDADFLNMLMMELANVVTGAGLVLSKTTYTQLQSAIKRIGQNTVVLADTGAVNAYTAVNAVPLVAGGSPTWVDGVVQAVKIAHTNTGPSTYAPDGLTPIPIYGLGLQPLQANELLLNGTAILMHATIAGVNSGNPICVLMECAGGAQQIPPATQPLHAVQFGQVSGVVGQSRNLVMNVAAASATATLTADEIVVETALGRLRYCLSSFNNTINLATTGAGGIDAGTATVGWLAVYVIYNPATGVSALLGQNAANAVMPQIYGGANMPSGYTASALVAVRRVSVAGLLDIGWTTDRTTYTIRLAAINTTAINNTLVTLSVSSFVPGNAKEMMGDISGSGSGNIVFGIAANGAGTTNGIGLIVPTYNIVGQIYYKIPLIISQTCTYLDQGINSFQVNVAGYTI